jgi:hypothetical protein
LPSRRNVECGGSLVRDGSAVEGGVQQVQVAELLVRDAGDVLGPQLNGPLAGLEPGWAGDKASVAAPLRPVDRKPVPSHADEQAAAANLGGELLLLDSL